MASTVATPWSLEVVRGRNMGRSYPIGLGSIALGNALGGAAGIDLAGEEGVSPRRMAARQAVLLNEPEGLRLRDLDSPGGTFVNRQRLLPGQSRQLSPEDIIQLGSVQLRVSRGSTPSPEVKPSNPAAPAPMLGKVGALPSPFTLKKGPVCRTWDDFLTISAQSWAALVDEDQSGRLAEYLRTIGRDDLILAGRPRESADERLDAWLGRLPTTFPAAPDLQAHPTTLRIRANAGGGLTRRAITITNTGYRLLRSTARIEPATVSWARLAPAAPPQPFSTAETTDLPLDVEVPESLDRPLVCHLAIESNGGSTRIEIRVERVARAEDVPSSPPSPASTALPLAEAISRVPMGRRILALVAAVLAFRLVLRAGEFTPSAATSATLAAAVFGSAVGVHWARREGAAGDVPFAGFAGGFAGVLAASIAIAAVGAVEPMVGLGSLPIALGFWAASALLVALGSSAILAPRSPGDEPS